MSANPSETVARAAVAEETSGEGRKELGALLRGESLRSQAAAAAVVLGKIIAVDEAGTVSVQLSGAAQPRPARLGAALSTEELLAAAATGRAAILAFENGDPTLPILMGLIQATGPRRESEREAEPVMSPEAAASARSAAEARAQEVHAEVDGRRVRIVAEDEIVLECGGASIILRRNGRVVIRGAYVESYSEGTNRIKGGQVRIN
jgi:Domain of unknown function (DUF6484)